MPTLPTTNKFPVKLKNEFLIGGVPGELNIMAKLSLNSALAELGDTCTL